MKEIPESINFKCYNSTKKYVYTTRKKFQISTSRDKYVSVSLDLTNDRFSSIYRFDYQLKNTN